MSVFRDKRLGLKLELASRRLNHILTFTYDIRVAAEVHLALEDIEAVIKELGKAAL